MTASTELIKELREQTGAGVLECKKALEETSGDLEQAADLLRQRGMAKAAKRADRETSAGMLDLYQHGDGRVGVMVEVNCETDFVARTDDFRNFAHELALQVAATAPLYVSEDDVPESVLQSKREAHQAEAVADEKPADVVERIVEGRVSKWLDEVCLLRQTYVRDEDKLVADLLNETVAALGENVQIRRFVRWEVGEADEG